MATHLSLLLLLLFLFSHSSPFSASARHQHLQLPVPVPQHSPRAAAASLTMQIRQACAATRYTDVCESTLFQSLAVPPDPKPLDLIFATVSSSSDNLKTAQSMAQSILNASVTTNPNRTNAARNCLELLSYSSHRLSAGARALPGGALADARAWTGAALLYQYDCWSALKYVNGTQQVADAMSFLVHLTNLTSNALSMVAALQRYGADSSIWAPPQTERDGYWGDVGGGGSGGGQGPVSPRGGFPSVLEPNATVCKGGGCGYATVQAAVLGAPDYGAGRFLIHIKEGTYEETVRVPYEKTNVVFIGDGMGKTVITGSLSADMIGVSTYNTATVGVSGDGFMARDLTFENTAGPDAHQAVAFRSESDLSVLESVEFSGHQDTLYAHSLRQYYRSCRVAGTVDFIFGNSAAVFEDCLILVVPRQLFPEKGETNTVSAHGRNDPAQSTGFVFRGCVVNGSDDYVASYRRKPAVHRVYLGRPWKEYSRAVFINCDLEAIVRPEGWVPWSGDFALQTLFFGEFGSTGPGANATARVPWSTQIPPEHVDVYSVENFIQGAEWVPSNH